MQKRARLTSLLGKCIFPIFQKARPFILRVILETDPKAKDVTI